MLKINEQAPGFELDDQDGKVRKLADFAGKWLLLYFYPKDDTPGCTTEACILRDSYDLFAKMGVTVIGVSTDSVASHKKFAEKYQLPFILLADTEKKLVQEYGVWAKKKFMGREYMGTLRNSFLINPEGKVAKIYEGVTPANHAAEVLSDLKSLVK